MRPAQFTEKLPSLKQEQEVPLSEILTLRAMRSNNILIMRSDLIQHKTRGKLPQQCENYSISVI